MGIKDAPPYPRVKRRSAKSADRLLETGMMITEALGSFCKTRSCDLQLTRRYGWATRSSHYS